LGYFAAKEDRHKKTNRPILVVVIFWTIRMKDNRPNHKYIDYRNTLVVSHCEPIWQLESLETNQHQIDPDEYFAIDGNVT
jgi:hypothetical protein